VSWSEAANGRGLYKALGVKPVINASAALTVLGGSLMPEPVVDAMRKAADCFVDINELQRAVGRRIAELTHNEAALVVGGCAAGLAQVTAALMVGTDPHLIRRLPDTTGLKNEVLVHRAQRHYYDQAVRTAGAKLVEFGLPISTQPYDLEGAITERTVAVLYVVAGYFPRGYLSLEQTVEIAHRHGIPVVVDAAAQLPPPENLWRFTKDIGADVAVFSGGKDLRGPQASGIVVGKKEIVEAAALNGYPNHSLGRPMKIGKENVVGALAALEWYLAQDHPARLADCERQVALVQSALAGARGVTVERSFPGEAGEPLPRALVRLGGGARLARDPLRRALRDGDPSIEVGVAPEGIYVNPATLQPGEMETVANRLAELLG
jgi:D-glucosaminate-6-phosphate ammonia-lyase